MTRRRTTEGGRTTAPRRPRTASLALALAAGLLVVTASLMLPASAGTKEQLDQAKRDLARIQGELAAATADWQAAEGGPELTRPQGPLTKGGSHRP